MTHNIATLLILIFSLVGIFVGVLLNRAADNLPPPARRSFLETPRCPYCNSPRPPVEQFGIVSFALRRDKCHQCSAPLKLRAPLVELGTGALFGFLASRFEFGMYLLALAFFTAILILIAVIDLEHKLILNTVSLPATIAALVASPVVLASPNGILNQLNWNLIILSALGAAVGYAITFGIYWLGVLFLQIVNRNRATKIDTVAFGMGDVKLAGLLGALVGFPTIISVLVWTILLGGVGGALIIVFQYVRRGSFARDTVMPYALYLILAGWAYMVFRF